MSEYTVDVWIVDYFGWLLLVPLGPINLMGELVGPAGGVCWRQIASGVIGTYLWILIALWVTGYV